MVSSALMGGESPGGEGRGFPLSPALGEWGCPWGRGVHPWWGGGLESGGSLALVGGEGRDAQP
jgi:hypothetical protein